MRFGITGFVFALLMTGALDAEEVSVRRVVSNAAPSDLEKRLLTSATESGTRLSMPEPASSRQVFAATVVELLPNGDFESGPAIWTEASLQGWNLILESPDFPVDRYPHGGNWGVWLGGDDDEIAYVQQQVTVPLGSPTLNYWRWIDSDEDDCGYDFGGVLVNSTTVVESYGLCGQTNTGGWTLHSVDMSAYAGQTLDLQIRIETDVQVISSLYIDDVFFESEAIFVDGFESGDTSSWSDSTP